MIVLLALLETRREIVDKVIDIEAARWGDAQAAVPRQRSDWEAEVSIAPGRDPAPRHTVPSPSIGSQAFMPGTDAPEIEPFGGLLPEDGK